jgi:hypothetical protein
MVLSEGHQRTIRVAILADEPFFWRSRKYYHHIILHNYTWVIHNTTYRMDAAYLRDQDILHGQLNTSKYDVLLIPGGGVGNNQALMKGLTFLPKVRRFKRNITQFITQGGGCIGFCGGAAFITDLKKDPGEKPRTITERLYQKSSLHVSCVSSYFKHLAFPLFYPFQRNHPEQIGNSAYAFSFAPGTTKEGVRFHSIGCPVEIQIKKNNPIFSDFEENQLWIRWWAGQGLLVDEHPTRPVSVLATYPDYDLSEKEETRIYAWRYIGGIHGLFRSLLHAYRFVKKHHLLLKSIPLYIFYLAGDWSRTEQVINLNLGSKPCMTAEVYPSGGRGRIVLSAVHPEYMVWSGGYIEEVNSTQFHCIGTGLHQWKDVEPLSHSLQKEATQNWWILRRFVAWAAKVPDTDLPPKELGEITKEVMEGILKNIVWDGTFLQQIQSI